MDWNVSELINNGVDGLHYLGEYYNQMIDLAKTHPAVALDDDTLDLLYSALEKVRSNIHEVLLPIRDKQMNDALNRFDNANLTEVVRTKRPD